MKRFFLTFILLTGLSPYSLFAADAGHIDSIQMPAWLERDNVIQALRPDTVLVSGDIISTGENARVLVKLEEGSSIKLGENGKLDFKTLIAPPKKDGVFEGVFDALKGAFRFTTKAISKNRHRDVKIRIGVVTAGIRGTDIWGSAKVDKDILCLIEGDITAQRDGEAEFAMQGALSFYIVPKDKPALPIKPLPEEKWAKWKLETELVADGATVSASGDWIVNLMSLSSQKTAETFLQRIDSAGYAADISNHEINGQQWYRVRIEGFVSIEDARLFATIIDGKMGISQAWVEKI